MSLIECSECGKEISSHAARCVHCGFPANGTRPGICGKTTKLLLGVLLLSAVVGGVIWRESLLLLFQIGQATESNGSASRTTSAIGTSATASPSARLASGSMAEHETPADASDTGSIDPRLIFEDSPENATDDTPLAPGTGTTFFLPATSPSAILAASGSETIGTGLGTSVDHETIVRRVIERDKEISRGFQALDYTHYWTTEDLDKVAGCDASRKELLYALSALQLIDQKPEYELLIEFLRLENAAAMAVMDYYRDLIVNRYTRPANPFFVTRLQKAFSDIRKVEGKLEKYGWKKVYATWGQGKKETTAR